MSYFYSDIHFSLVFGGFLISYSKIQDIYNSDDLLVTF